MNHRSVRRRIGLGCLAALLLMPSAARAITVPGDYPTVQQALDAAGPGDVIEVATGIYNEKVTFTSNGTSANPITLTAAPGATPVLDGTGVAGDNVILIDTRSHVRVIGFEIRGNTGVSDGSGIRVLGHGSDIELRDNRIHEIRGKNAMGITVYATDATPIQQLTIDGNEIYDCDPRPSEALTLNGNVTDFEVTNNYVHDVNNIGIDMIGGETDIQPDPSKVARNGVVRGNTVARCGSGYSGGIYVDGGSDIVIENNRVTECDLGVEVAAENAGILTQNVTVRNNVLWNNRVVGIVFGGYASSVGRASNNVFRGNTLYKNATDPRDGVGEIWVQFGDDNVIDGNLVVSRDSGDTGVRNSMVASYNASSGNVFEHNLYYTADGAAQAVFALENHNYAGFSAWQGAGHDGAGVFADPQLVAPAAADFHIASSSPAVDAGDAAYVAASGETDMDGSTRVSGAAVDIGADEATCGDNVTDVGEQCDDGNTVSGDGCDANCTLTGCGNAIVTAGEQCDDGNTAAGDCCDGSCQLEAGGAPCDDGSVCTLVDTCDGAGTCVGTTDADPACVVPASAGGSALVLKDRDDKDVLVWKWGRGPEVALGALGDPVGGDDYTLCVYVDDGASSSVLLESSIPGGTSWSDLGDSGFKYKDRDTAPDGILLAQVRPGTSGHAKAKVKGKGARLGLVGLGFGASATVSAQLRNDAAGLCLGADFAAPFAKDDAGAFKGKSQ